MPDICKCANPTCSKRHKCYRYTCIGNERQVYSSFKPDEKTGECNHFISIDQNETLKQGNP